MEIPGWVKLMEDPSANYFEALKSYDQYWKTHARPAGEEDEMEMNQNTKGKSAKDLRKEEREREREQAQKKKLKGSELEIAEYLKYQSKRFENWALEVKPWVQENGHILTDVERADIWRKQQEELKKQESK